jgi:hypothetical protein
MLKSIIWGSMLYGGGDECSCNHIHNDHVVVAPDPYMAFWFVGIMFAVIFALCCNTFNVACYEMAFQKKSRNFPIY